MAMGVSCAGLWAVAVARSGMSVVRAGWPGLFIQLGMLSSFIT